jgi:NADH:ubiquinone oxidoreductase subunit 6 (subunit J)
MPTFNQQNAKILLQQTNKTLSKKINFLSAQAELALFSVLVSLALFTAAVALAHTLSFLASALGGPLFTLLTPGAAVVFAALVPVLANPVHALLCLLGLFAATALIYLSLGAEYLGLVFSLVYLGALAILFLYVIMLLNVKDIMSAQQAAQNRGYRYLFSGLIGTLLVIRLPVKVQEGFQSAVLFSAEGTRAYRTPLEALTTQLETDILSLRGLYEDS